MTNEEIIQKLIEEIKKLEIRIAILELELQEKSND